jgi:hypothetical protein
MKFTDLFNEKNDINEKSIIGFISFAIMLIYAIASIIGGFIGFDLPINETIYNSFVTVTLGSFGIAEAGRIFTRSSNPSTTIEKTPTETQDEVDEYKNAE